MQLLPDWGGEGRVIALLVPHKKKKEKKDARTCLLRIGGFHDSCRRPVQISMHVYISFGEVALDEQLVLLRISAAQHQHVFAGDEPVEALEPIGLAGGGGNGYFFGLKCTCMRIRCGIIAVG